MKTLKKASTISLESLRNKTLRFFDPMEQAQVSEAKSKILIRLSLEDLMKNMNELEEKDYLEVDTENGFCEYK